MPNVLPVNAAVVFPAFVISKYPASSVVPVWYTYNEEVALPCAMPSAPLMVSPTLATAPLATTPVSPTPLPVKLVAVTVPLANTLPDMSTTNELLPPD